MKKYCFISIVIFIIGFVFTSCDDVEHYIPTDTQSIFSFVSATASVSEGELDKDTDIVTENTLTITVRWSKFAAMSGNVNLEVFPRTSVPAVEGKDYTISIKTLNFSDDEYLQTFTITTKYDDTFTGRKTFTVKLSSTDIVDARLGTLGASDSCVVSINDINHPLTAMIGNVKLSYLDFFKDAVVSYNSTIVPDDNNVNVLLLYLNIFSDHRNEKPMKLEVGETVDGKYKIQIKLPQEAGSWNSSGTMLMRYEATFFVNEDEQFDPNGKKGDAWDIVEYDEDADDYKFIPVTLTGTTPKDQIRIEFDYGFWFSVYDEDYTYVSDDGWIGNGPDIVVPGTLVIEKP